MRNKATILLTFLSIWLLVSFQIQELPAANEKVLEFCEENMKKKIGRGQCWDLAEAALNYADANWSTPYNFGKEIDWKSDPILAGDVLQFEKVKFKSANSTAEFPHHTAIVYEVLEKGKIIIVHQNFNSVQKLTTLELNLNELNKGLLMCFRPQEK